MTFNLKTGKKRHPDVYSPSESEVTSKSKVKHLFLYHPSTVDSFVDCHDESVGFDFSVSTLW